jgi:uncharacterized membrane protein YdjX (TVP38/TMEM64 family)
MVPRFITQDRRDSSAYTTTKTAQKEESGRGLYVKLIVLAVVLLAALTAWVAYDVGAFLTLDGISKRLQSTGAFAPVVFMLIMALSVVLTPIPGLPLNILAGPVFGPYWGTLYVAVGSTLGAVASFTLARFFGRAFIARFLRGHINFCRRCSDMLVTKIVFFSRLIPFVSFDLVSYGAGLTRMSPWKFGIATFLGTLPLSFIYTAYGAVILENSFITWIGGLAIVALFFLLPTWIDRYDLFGLKHYFQHHPEPIEASMQIINVDSVGDRDSCCNPLLPAGIEERSGPLAAGCDGRDKV